MLPIVLQWSDKMRLVNLCSGHSASAPIRQRVRHKTIGETLIRGSLGAARECSMF